MMQTTSPPEPVLADETIDTIVYGLPEIVRAIAVSRNSVTSTLRLAQMRALLRLASAEGLTMGELARRIGVSCAAATQVVDQLVDLGLVARERDMEDRRVVRLWLTERARPELEQALARRARQVREVCAQLRPEEAAGFARGITLLSAALARDLHEQRED
ncbi:MAG: MarR family transcriptional regulator [Thermomicrobiales bacterium]|jgi:DNA-binding MarR family transcriptional regulator|nr:MarR family transcriptional regulator [Thermomicrobiales bacterium]